MGDKENDGHCHTVPVHSVMIYVSDLTYAYYFNGSNIFSAKSVEVTIIFSNFAVLNINKYRSINN